MKKRGFSIVELAIVIALIGILSLIVFVSLRNGQVSARDNERHSKAESIARSLEIIYKSGNQSTGGTHEAGSYPTMEDIDEANKFSFLPSIDESTTTFSWQNGGGSTLKSLRSKGSLNNHNTENMTVEGSSVGLDEFIYVPYTRGFASATVMPGDADGWGYCLRAELAFGKCSRFNIYYRTEADNALHTIRSTNQ